MCCLVAVVTVSLAGPIPVGYRFLAQSTSDSTNQIPVEGAPDAEGDYRKLLGELEHYLTNDGQSHNLPPLFAKVRQAEGKVLPLLSLVCVCVCVSPA